MIFDIKMEDFRRKSRFLVVGHVTKSTATIMHASVVLRNTVCVEFTVGYLNDL